MLEKIKFGILEEHALISNLLVRNLEESGEKQLIFTSTAYDDLISQLDKNKIDVLLLDVNCRCLRGWNLFNLISSCTKDFKTVVYGLQDNDYLAEKLFSFGVSGLVAERYDFDEINRAVSDAFIDKRYLSFAYANKLNDSKSENELLTQREYQILNLIAQEFTTTEISKDLKIAISTVENHRKNIFKKLHVKNAAGMVLNACRLGYL